MLYLSSKFDNTPPLLNERTYIIMKFFILGYLLAINIVAFITFGVDKYKAKNKKWRIPEATLITLCLLGGSVGGYLGMRIFHHKTKHPKFYIGVPVIFIMQITISIFIIIS